MACGNVSLGVVCDNVSISMFPYLVLINYYKGSDIGTTDLQNTKQQFGKHILIGTDKNQVPCLGWYRFL